MNSREGNISLYRLLLPNTIPLLQYYFLGVLQASQKEMYLLGKNPQVFKCELQKKFPKLPHNNGESRMEQDKASTLWKGMLQEFSSSENSEYLNRVEKNALLASNLHMCIFCVKFVL